MSIKTLRFRFYICIALVTILATPSQASLVDMDWILVGDTSLIQDTSTGYKWLDLSITADMSYNTVLSQLQPGGSFDGFRYATREEVLHIWSEAGISDTNFVWLNNGEYSAVKNLADRFGTSPLTGIHTHALGMVEGTPLLPANERRVMELSYNNDGVQVRTSADYYTFDVSANSIHYSSYLVKVVPVPATAWLFGSGFLALIGLARRRN